MKQTLEEAVNEIGGVHPDWDKITCLRIGFKEGARWQSKQSPWISVKERLPEVGELVLTKGAYGFLICYFSSLGEWETGANVNKERLGITHYMPIPSFDEILKNNNKK